MGRKRNYFIEHNEFEMTILYVFLFSLRLSQQGIVERNLKQTIIQYSFTDILKSACSARVKDRIA